MRISRGLPHGPQAPLALTIGNFDGVHLGHQAMLDILVRTARERALTPAVMTFEPQPREFFAPDKAPTRLTSLREKLELLAACGVARTHVCRFNFEFARIPPEDFIERILITGLGARWLLVGDDFRFGARRAGDIGLLREAAGRFGFAVESMRTVLIDGERVSSTAVRTALAAGDLPRAAKLLGRPYSMSGRVVRGDGIGRRLGYPTANVQMKRNRPPLAGIFAVVLSGAGDVPRRGVASLGVRPTVHAGGVPVLEVHLFDFDATLYGRHVRVDFLHKFRDEEKYVDLDALRRQIGLDAANAREWFARLDAAGREKRA